MIKTERQKGIWRESESVNKIFKTEEIWKRNKTGKSGYKKTDPRDEEKQKNR